MSLALGRDRRCCRVFLRSSAPTAIMVVHELCSNARKCIFIGLWNHSSSDVGTAKHRLSSKVSTDGFFCINYCRRACKKWEEEGGGQGGGAECFWWQCDYRRRIKPEPSTLNGTGKSIVTRVVGDSEHYLALYLLISLRT
ncbi:hypothetical protein GOP47_0021575 [Adiantum capillus-veneris]|uniref:Uncharacterized protein n=1 Tax=Adiantum capillus-veneris TaxID=13818 RepID=A0A9D4U7S0_ADICA|nr:hypothetical protein GOP47_0021575 [Adiantum capillus-veneris]